MKHSQCVGNSGGRQGQGFTFLNDYRWPQCSMICKDHLEQCVESQILTECKLSVEQPASHVRDPRGGSRAGEPGRSVIK